MQLSIRLGKRGDVGISKFDADQAVKNYYNLAPFHKEYRPIPVQIPRQDPEPPAITRQQTKRAEPEPTKIERKPTVIAPPTEVARVYTPSERISTARSDLTHKGGVKIIPHYCRLSKKYNNVFI